MYVCMIVDLPIVSTTLTFERQNFSSAFKCLLRRRENESGRSGTKGKALKTSQSKLPNILEECVNRASTMMSHFIQIWISIKATRSAKFRSGTSLIKDSKLPPSRRPGSFEWHFVLLRRRMLKVYYYAATSLSFAPICAAFHLPMFTQSVGKTHFSWLEDCPSRPSFACWYHENLMDEKKLIP